MSTLAGKSTAAAVLEKVDGIVEENKTLKGQVTTLREDMVALKEKSAVALYPNGVNPHIVGGITGARHGISEGYSVLRAAKLAMGRLKPQDAKYEVDCHEKLKDLYEGQGFRQEHNTLLIPFGTEHISATDSNSERFVGELKQKMVANGDKVDPYEMDWLNKKFGMRQKDLGTLSDITGSTPATGSLDLVAKKLGIRVDLNNELLRFNSISAESMVRTDMAKVAALKADLAMLEGTGGTQIKGLVTYASAATWTPGTDNLIAYTVTSNTFQVNDAAEMEALMPDTAGEPTAWVMRRQLWAKIRNRRFAAGASATDSAGGYLVNMMREFSDQKPLQLDGTPVVRSTQVSATRGSGAQTYVLLGYFPDFIIGRFGVLEFLSTNVSDQAFQNDQTQLRCIEHIDAGPRHASSFVFADAITVQ